MTDAIGDLDDVSHRFEMSASVSIETDGGSAGTGSTLRVEFDGDPARPVGVVVGTGRRGSLRLRIGVAWGLLRRAPNRCLPAFGGYWFFCSLAVLFGLGDASPGGMLAAVVAGLVLAGVFAVWRWSAMVVTLARSVRHPLQDALGVIDTERLVLRRPARQDSVAFAATVDAETIEANGFTEAQVRRDIEYMRLGIGDPHDAALLVTVRSTGTVIGHVGVYAPHDDEDDWHLGWWIGPGFRGQGYGTEALRAVLAAVHATGVQRVIVGTATDNLAVHRVLDKLGAHHIDTRPHTLPNGATITSNWFAHDTQTAASRNVSAAAPAVGP